MAEPRDRPYSQFNFIVSIADVNNGGVDPDGGFQEVSGLGSEITVAEYRNGNEAFNTPRKITGLSKVSDVTLKRGVMGDLKLAEWMRKVAEGKQDQLKTVVVQLLSEDREQVAQTWTVYNARPMKYTGPTLAGAGGEIAVEELVLSCERIDQS